MESSRVPRLTPATRGFSLVEMLVVLTIIAIVTTVALLGQGNFNRSMILTDTAYSLALSLREVQTLGYSSRIFGNVQNAGYGAYFTTTAPSSYILFADTSPAAPGNSVGGACGGHDTSLASTHPEAKPGDCSYTAGSDGLVQNYLLGRGFRISQFCGKGTGTNPPRYCSTDGTNGLTALSVLFLRSSPDTLFMGYRSASGWTALTSAEIYILAPDGTNSTRGICVSRAGQVSVVTGTCP